MLVWNRALFLLLLPVFSIAVEVREMADSFPIVINTWDFKEANLKAWEYLSGGSNILDSIEEGCTVCEELQCDGTVGYGGSPDESGETTLDAMIMDGNNLNVGAVGCLRNIKPAMRVARKVLDHTKHTLLVGEKATQFAETFGFKQESLSTDESLQKWQDWKEAKCQPNFWINMSPDPATSCGPYQDTTEFNERIHGNSVKWGRFNHDTIGMIGIDSEGNIGAGTSTNGASHKIPGRVGDSPIPGAGAYADTEVGAAAATGDGDVMMRVLPSLLAVEYMRAGRTPLQAAQQAISRISSKYPDFVGAVIAVNKAGQDAAACHGIDEFPYIVSSPSVGAGVKRTVKCST